MALKPIQILINAKDNASAVFSGLQAKVVAVGAAIATYFGINAFVGVVKGAADLEQAMSRVQASTGATGDEMAALRKAAEDAGASTKFTSTEAAGALENLAKAGLDAKDAIATLPAVLNLAQAGDIGLAESAELVTKAVSGMGLAFADAARVADVLALGANATNTSVLGLAQALSYAAPVASSLGLSLESTVAIIGKFADAGIDASRAGTALNAILSQFSNPASKFRDELAAAGITTNDFEKALHQLAAAGPAGSKAIIAVGQEAGPALRALLNQGMTALDGLTARLKTAEGSAAATAAVMQNNLNGAFSGLASAWDTVKNALGTPVLPVLTEGVQQLAAAFRSAVADGTVTKFGESIATAFRSGLQFVRDFVATVDFTAVLARLQGFANSTNETFTKIGEFATNAGNVVKLAWGVMTAGIDGAMAVIYKVTEIMVAQFARIQLGAATLIEILSKITFGDVSARFKVAADEIRLSAEATAAASQALGEKAKAALEGSMQGAELAREGWAGVTAAIYDTAKATDAWAEAVAKAAAEIEATGKAQAKANAQAETAKKVADDQAAATTAAKNAVAALRIEYQAAVDSRNWQEAARIQGELRKALDATAASAEDAAAQVAAAFQRLGVTSSAELSKQAANAKRDFDLVREAGTSTAEDIGAAFKVAAEAAIAANKGIAPSWVTAQAGVRGYKIEVDAAGKSVVRSMKEAKDATDDVTDSARGAAGGYRDMGAAAALAGEQAKKLQALYDKNKVGDGSDLVGKSGDLREAAVMEYDINQAIAKRYGDDAVGSDLAEEAWQLRQLLESYQRNYGNARSKESLDQQRNIGAELARVESLLDADLKGGGATGTGQRSGGGGTSAPTGNTTSTRGGTGTGGGGGGGLSASAGPTVVNITLNANGINDPVKLARLLEPELKKMQARAR